MKKTALVISILAGILVLSALVVLAWNSTVDSAADSNQVSGITQPLVGEDITVEFINSTYEIASGETSGWFTSGQDADIMLSGIDFNNTGGPLLFNHPTGIASDGTHLLLADTRNNRVLIWNSLPTGNVPPNIVLGQENFYSNNPGRGLNQMNWPMGVSTDGQHVVVADTNNDRILIWNTFPTYSGQPANLVIEGDPTIPKRWIDWPWGIWTNGIKLVVASTASARVLIWNTFPTQNNQSADIYLTGQGQIVTPRNIVSDGAHLIVGDHNANVPGATSPVGNFFWSSFPITNDQLPDFFMSDAGCPGGAWMRGDFTSDGKLVLLGVALYIWNTFPANNSTPPDLTVGVWWPEPGGTKYWFKPAEGAGLALAAGRLYTTSNNAIIGFNSLPTTEDAQPDFAVGGPDAYTNTLETNYFIGNPVPATDGTSLFVSSDHGKLYVWKHLPDESGAKPDIVYSGLMAPWDSALFENTLVLAGKETVYIWNNLPLNGEMPDLRFEKSIGNVTFQELRGVALDDQYFYLADRNANKIYVWEGIPNQSTNPKFSVDIEVPTRLSSDGTYLVAASTEAINSHERIKFYRVDQLSFGAQPTFLTGINVNLPEAALAVNGHLFVADTPWSRVLVWSNISDAVAGSPPEVVLGEEDFNDTLPEIGVDKLFWPAGLAFDGSYLWVGEFKFSGRVVRFPVKPISHEPIYIDGNDDFVIGENGVVSGNGTETNPYIIENWDISASSANGIDIRNTDVYFTIRNCKIHNNSDGGIYFNMVENSTVSNNYISDNLYGVFLNSSHYNHFDGNVIRNSTNGDGFSMDNSNHNTLVNNTIESNKYKGIGLWGSSNNLIYHNNLIGNSPNGYDDTSTNSWDNGTEGNYWNDYAGIDDDGNGIGDTPYDISGGASAKDNYPFIEENGWIPNQPPIADFTYSPLNPVVNEIITFDASSSYDPDGTIISYEWGFGEGNTSTEQNPTHQYIIGGTYTVTLTVTDDDNATDSCSMEITVSEESLEQGDWIKEAGIRVDHGVSSCTIKLPNGTYRMYYTGLGIVSAYSADGINFVKEAGTRIASEAPGSDQERVANCAIIVFPNGSYRLIYEGVKGQHPNEVHKFFSAFSADGLNFVKESGIRLESEGTSDYGQVSVPDIIKLPNGSYRMYYVGDFYHVGTVGNSIRSAISFDCGLTWIREGDRLSTPNTMDPDVIILTNGTYRLFYTAPAGGIPENPMSVYSAISYDCLNWTIEEGARLSPGGPYDMMNCMDPDVVQLLNGSYRMYYSGMNAPEEINILSALSPKIEEWPTGDWLKESGIRIAEGSVPYVLRLDNGSYRLYYNNPDGIFSAISTDGLNFIKENGTRLKGTNIPGDPEWQAHGATVVNLDNGSYRMYYIGATGDGGPGHAIHRIYSAISNDGLNFVREGIRIESSGTIDNGWASVPEIVRTFDGKYRLYYCSMGAKSIASAISDDGLNFVREYGPGVGNGTGVYGADPAVCKLPNGTYWMFFTSPGGPMPPWYLEKGIYSAWSEDGVNFTLEPGVRVSTGGVYDSQNVFDPAVIQLLNGSFRMYYGGQSDMGVVTLSAISPKILVGNQPPVAYIDSISPNPATQGVSVTFVGHGNDTDGTITAYNWRSSIDGQLSTSASFSISTLSVGTHTIYFKVQDNNGTWSNKVSNILVVNPAGGGVDTAPPEIKDVRVVPETQMISGYVNITCTVTDNIGINIVKVNITYPNGEAKNITMMQIGDNSYSYNTSYSVLGSYSYYIWADDISGNQNKSATYQFNITVSTVPVPISVKVTVAGREVNITSVGTGTIDVSEVALPQAPPENLHYIGIRVNVTITGTLTYANITIKYNNSDVENIDETKLRMYYWNETEGKWKLCERTGVDIINNIVWANVTHLTIFAPMAEKVAEVTPAPVNLFIYAGIAAVIVILAVSLIVIMKRRKKLEEAK